LNLNNTELKTFLNLKINNLTLYQNKYKESLIQNIKIQNQPTQSAFDNTHNLSIQQNSIPLSNNLTLNTATKKLNILELVREKKKKQINLSTTDLNLPIINDNLQLINNQIQKQKFNFIKNNILKIKNINKLNINKIRINKSKINKLKIKTYNIITFAKNNLITNYLKLNSIFFKLLNINQFFLIINYLLYQFNLILLKNKKFKIYNFFKLNNILKQIIIKNPDFTFGLHTTFLNKIKTIKLNYLKHSLLDFNSKTSILCKKIILLINKNYTYKNTNTLKYVLKKQIYLKYKKLLNNYQNNLIKKKNLLNYNYIYYKLYQNNKLKLKKKNFKNFFFKSLHFTTTYNLQKLILLKKSHTYIKYITKKINKKKIKHLLQMFKIYIFIFKSYFVNFRNFKNNFYIKNKIKLNSNK
jgi:hypothetical protein